MLDNLFDNLEDPRRQAMLMMAAGLLSPVRGKGMAGFGEAMSRGIEGGLLGYNQASKSKREREMEKLLTEQRQLQLDQARQEADYQTKATNLAGQYFQPPTPSVPYNDTLGNQPPQADIPGNPGKADLGGYSQALMGLGPKGINQSIAIQQALQKDNPFGKVDPEKFTPESVRAFMNSGGRDFSLLQPRVKMESVDTGAGVKFVNPYAPPAEGLTKTLTPGEQQRIPMERARLGMEAGRYNYEMPQGAQLPQKLVDTVRADVLKKESESRLAAQQGFPQFEAEAKQTIGLIDKLLAHPGFSTVVGAKGPTGVPAAAGYPIPGTDAANFVVLRNQLVGKQFLQAYETLKGTGQITEIEGKKATDAIARMDTSQSEDEFRKAAGEFRGVIEAGLARARDKAGVAPIDIKTVTIGGQQYEARRGKQGKFYVQVGNRYYEVSE